MAHDHEPVNRLTIMRRLDHIDRNVAIVGRQIQILKGALTHIAAKGRDCPDRRTARVALEMYERTIPHNEVSERP